MKTWFVLLAALGIGLAQAQGQNAQTSTNTNSVAASAAEFQSTKPKTPAQAAVPTAERGAKPPENNITYGGVLVDVAKSENLKKTFSLRKPADPKHDEDNLYRDQHGKAKGWVLFAIKF